MDDTTTEAIIQVLMIMAEDNARREYLRLGGTEEQWDALDKEGFKTGAMAGIMVAFDFVREVDGLSKHIGDPVQFGRTNVPE